MEETLSYYADVVGGTGARSQTNNPLERLDAGRLDDERVWWAASSRMAKSALMLVAARLRYVAGYHAVVMKRYPETNWLADVVGHRLTSLSLVPTGTRNKPTNPTTVLSANQDRMCEKLWTLTHQRSRFAPGEA